MAEPTDCSRDELVEARLMWTILAGQPVHFLGHPVHVDVTWPDGPPMPLPQLQAMARSQLATVNQQIAAADQRPHIVYNRERAVMANPTHPPHLLDVRALTLKNPWAHAIAWHGKDVENRGWVPPQSVDQLLIHAGKGWDPAGREQLDDWGLLWDTAAASAIVAVADLSWVCADGPGCSCDSPWAARDQYHWVLGNVWTLRNPVPCDGKLGLWKPSQSVVDAVRADLVSVAAGVS